MKKVAMFFIIIFALALFAGTAFAKEMSGEVTAVDAAKGTLTVKSAKITAAFDCEEGSVAKDVKVGDHVTVVYHIEKGGKKIATMIKIMPMKKKTSGGGY